MASVTDRASASQRPSFWISAHHGTEKIIQFGKRCWLGFKGGLLCTVSALPLGGALTVPWLIASNIAPPPPPWVDAIPMVVLVGVGAFGFFLGWRMLAAAVAGNKIPVNDLIYGSARFADEIDIKRHNLHHNNGYGFPLGRILVDGKPGSWVNYAGADGAPTQMLCTIGPTGSGKTTHIILNILMTLRYRSAIVTDPKRQISAVAGERRAQFGKVWMIDPLGPFSHGFNPLDLLDPNSNSFVSDASALAEAALPVDTNSKQDGHWLDGGRALFAALIMAEKIQKGHDASLANVQAALNQRRWADDKGEAQGLLRHLMDLQKPEMPHAVRSKSERFLEKSKEVEGFINAARTPLAWLDDPAFRKDITKHGPNFGDLKSQLGTVFLVVPPERLEEASGYLRLVTTCAVRQLFARKNDRHSVYIALEEFAALRKLSVIGTLLNVGRDFDLVTHVIIQTLSQLAEIYGPHGFQTLMSSFGAITSFEARDQFTRDYLSEMCGSETVRVPSMHDRAIDQARKTLLPGASGYVLGSKRLMPPEDIGRIDDNTILTWCKPCKDPMLCQTSSVWQVHGNRAKANPFYKGASSVTKGQAPAAGFSLSATLWRLFETGFPHSAYRVNQARMRRR